LISNPTAISTMTGVFHFMAVSLDLNLLIHAISVSQTCQLGVKPASIQPGRKSATMGGRAGNQRRSPRNGASRRPATALPLYAHLPAASPPSSAIDGETHSCLVPLPRKTRRAALGIGRGATVVRLRP